MKKIFIAILMLPALAFSQVGGITTGSGTSYNTIFNPNTEIDKSEEFKELAPKMYITTSYLAANVDDIVETFFLRYNMYRDEMEFSKNDQLLYLKKINDRTIVFQNLNTKYKLFELNNDLKYFIVHNEGKNQLLSRQTVTYQEEKPPVNSYVAGKKADFIRNDDIFYIKFDNNSIIEVPSNKRKFYAIFDGKESEIKNYMKSNRLNNKDLEDLKKIVTYFNSL
ncbi:hypothetical protein [Polaribacter sp. Hel_I_88]|uniref:hypothetical protein n=1 Tax=Polaribacter sp. Hel_I_88 TaxID=1250006 RepID=UPI00047EEF5D|nr:hypothetical protein [Polaribacter sp. Hel_I_88]